MKAKWIAVLLSGGMLLSLGSCASDLGYYLMDTLIAYLPDLIAAVQDTST